MIILYKKIFNSLKNNKIVKDNDLIKLSSDIYNFYFNDNGKMAITAIDNLEEEINLYIHHNYYKNDQYI